MSPGGTGRFSYCGALLIALGCVGGGPAVAQDARLTVPTPAGGRDPRLAIEALAQNLDDAVRLVCRPSPANLFGPVQMTRGYRIPGVGVVFVVPPRTLSPVRIVRLRDRRQPHAAGATGPGPQAAPAPQAVRRAPQKATPTKESQEERNLRAFEEQMRTMNATALRMHQEAEEMFEQMLRDAAPPTATGGPRLPPAPVPAQPPWAEWWSSEELSDTRTPRQIVDDVRQTLGRVLLGSAPLGLREGESCVVSVEFVANDAFDFNPRPATTLVARLTARDLEALREGDAPTEELLKRIEFHEFE